LPRYWEKEEPLIFETDHIRMAIFSEARKVQLYRRIESAPRGVGRAVTLDFESMSEDEIKVLKKAFSTIFDTFQKGVTRQAPETQSDDVKKEIQRRLSLR